MGKGFLLRFYRDNAPVEKKTTDAFDIVSFVQFDGIRVYPINGFTTFAIHPPLKDSFGDKQFRRFEYDRRRLNIYALCNEDTTMSESEDIYKDIPAILDPKSSYCNLPIMVVTFFNIKKGQSDEAVHAIREGMKNYKKEDSSDFKFDIFGSLGMIDLVMVLRCQSFKDSSEILRHVYNSQSYITSGYTIPSLCKPLMDKWQEEKDGLNISLRLSLKEPNTESITALAKMLWACRAFKKDSRNIWYSYGTYDIEFCAPITNVQAFKDLFYGTDPTKAHLSETSNFYRKYILLANTRFAFSARDDMGLTYRDYTTFDSFDEKPADDTHSPRVISALNAFNTFINFLILTKPDINDDYYHLTKTERTTLVRLFMRIGAICHSSFFTEMKDEAIKLGDAVINLAHHTINLRIRGLDKNSKFLSDCFHFIYTYIENRALSTRRDFGTQNMFNLSFGEGYKLLSEYGKTTNMIVKLLKAIRLHVRPTDISEFMFFPMVGFSSDVCLETFDYGDGGESKRYRLGFFQLPVEFMYDVPNVLAYILHETGHRMRLERCKRNRHFVEEFFPFLLNYELKHGIKEIAKGRLNDDEIDDIIHKLFDESFKHDYSIMNANFKTSVLWDSICSKKCEEGLLPCKTAEKRCSGETIRIEDECYFNSDFKTITHDIKNWCVVYISKLSQDSRMEGEEKGISRLIENINDEVMAYSFNAWSEAYADIYSVEVLDLSVDRYLKIRNNHFRSVGRKPNRYEFVRMCAVCAYIADKKQGVVNKGEIYNHVINSMYEPDIPLNNKDAFIAYFNILYKALKACLMANLDSAFMEAEIGALKQNVKDIFDSCIDSSGDENDQTILSVDFEGAIRFATGQIET